MSNLILRFTDPTSRKAFELPVKTTAQPQGEGDGYIDLNVDGFDGGNHLRLAAALLGAEERAALARALENPEAAGLSVRQPGVVGFGRASEINLRGHDLAHEPSMHVYPALPGLNMDATGARQPVYFTRGRFSASEGRVPETPEAIGEGLYAAAKLADDSPGNAVESMGLNPQQRRDLLTSLKWDLELAPAGRTPAEGLDPQQALQLRSSGSTMLLELMTAKGNSGEVTKEAFALYKDQLQNESNPTLRDQMALHLGRFANKLPPALQTEAKTVSAAEGPTTPPYDAWFQDGDNTLTVNWSAGPESLKDDKKRLRTAGFRSSDNETFTKTYFSNGEETTFSVKMRPFRNDMFDQVGDDKTEMQIYTGHSNWGRNMRDSLDGVNTGKGGEGKLVFTDLCVGKGEMQQFRDKFPKADFVTTFNSSYFIPGSEFREPNSEGINAILTTFDGIAARKDYASIAEDVRRGNPWRRSHEREGVDNNFIFPTDAAVRRRVLDADHDGQADLFDRLVDFNTFKPEEDAARDFQAIEHRAADQLDGTKAHFASMTVTRIANYNERFSDETEGGQLVPAGYFDPAPGEKNLFRFERTAIDGKDGVTMKMSSHHAHMSEDALRAAGCYEFARFINGERGELSPVDDKIHGLLMASHSLKTDTGYEDRRIWKALLESKGLPAIPRSLVEEAKASDKSNYAGGYQAVEELKELLSPELLSQLEA